ncbi:hypothetical protein [Curtobacterium sp. MCBD17_032]|uniref:hypothetical protein n=1 Tax=Curtobacterium sp. MCBD17_032 TaxID=2175659 RepID=UPI000DA76D14|nr:hypothetical protein [Curtobacterium sp. MCBD17_032]PZE84361.1 hypothetical protein DEI91_08555 [Curtobacterium sp. MCBD17_032]
MSQTDDDAAARARLERVAWGAGSTPTEAVRARIALADLDREARRRSRSDVAPGTPPGTPSGAEGRRRPAGPASGRRPSAVPPDEPAAVSGTSSPDARGAGGHAVDSGDAGPGAHQTDEHEAVGRDAHRAVEHRADEHRPDEHRAVRPATADGGTGRDGTDRDGAGRDGAGWRGTGRGGAGLLAGARRLTDRVRRTDRTVLWASGGAAVVVGLVLGAGVGLSVGARTAEPARTTVTPAAGTVTVEQMLDMPQTFADQLPGSIEAPVALRSTRLVFTNRSLSGDAAGTPWNVWAAVGRDPSTICLVATADRIEGTSACYPREDALHGTVSLSATSASGTVWVRLVGGAVRGTVTSTATSRMY